YINPGVTLKISDDKRITLMDNSRIEAIGKKDSIITFKAENNYWAGIAFTSANMNHSLLEFVTYQDVSGLNIFPSKKNLIIKNTLISNNNSYYLLDSVFRISRNSFGNMNNIYDNYGRSRLNYYGGSAAKHEFNSNYINNTGESGIYIEGNV